MKKIIIAIILLTMIIIPKETLYADDIPDDGSWKFMVNDQIYAFYGQVSPNDDEDWDYYLNNGGSALNEDISGTIYHSIDQKLTPTENDEGNFGIGYDYRIYQGVVDIKIGDIWYSFELEHDPTTQIRYLDYIIEKNNISYNSVKFIESFNQLSYKEQIIEDERLNGNAMPDDIKEQITLLTTERTAKEIVSSIANQQVFFDRFVFLGLAILIGLSYFLRKLKFYQTELGLGLILLGTLMKMDGNYALKSVAFPLIGKMPAYDHLIFIESIDWICVYIILAIMIISVCFYLWDLKS